MFENIIGQKAVSYLALELAQKTFPPAVLFYGPRFSGKGSAALETARVLSCGTEGAPWSCECGNCARHKLLSHPDMLALGSRNFTGEICAARDAFLRQKQRSAKILFFRSVKKLLLRFSPVLQEEDAKIAKAASIVESLAEDLEEWLLLAEETEIEKINKLTGSIVKAASNLENEFLSSGASISNIRAAITWLHSSPSGNKKTLIIENAEKMQDAARNSMLKLLEEPPSMSCVILTSVRPKMLLPTILGRLRPYSFSARSANFETEVLRRVFYVKDADFSKKNALEDFFDGYIPVKMSAIRGAAAFFLAASAAQAVRNEKSGAKDSGAGIKDAYILLGKHTVPIAAEEGFNIRDAGKNLISVKLLVGGVSAALQNFEDNKVWTLFLQEMLSLTGQAFNEAAPNGFSVQCRKTVGKAVKTAQTDSETYNISKLLVLEKLRSDISCGALRRVKS